MDFVNFRKRQADCLLCFQHLIAGALYVPRTWYQSFHLSFCKKATISHKKGTIPRNIESYNKQQPNIITCFWTLYHHTHRERSVQGWVGHPAGDFGARGDTGGHREVGRQGVRPIAMLPMAGQRALIWQDHRLCVCRREG